MRGPLSESSPSVPPARDAASAPLSLRARLAALRGRYLDAQLRGDRREALRLVDEEGLSAGLSVPALHLHVITPAQQEIGRLWQANVIHVAQEHAATAISQLVVAHLYRHLPVAPPSGRRVVVACAPGERHELGARIASDFLEAAGFTVTYLGADVPAVDLVRQATEERAEAVVLSAATGLCTPGLVEAVRAVRRTFGDDFPVLAGGAAFGDEASAPACDVPADVLHHGLDAPGLVALVASRLDVALPARFVEEWSREAAA